MIDNLQKGRNLTSWIKGYIDYTEGVGAEPELRKWAALFTITAALERRAWVRTRAGRLYPNMYVLLVTAPGGGKDQAIQPARHLYAAAGMFNLAPSAVTNKGMIDYLALEQSQRSIEHNGKFQIYHTATFVVPEFGVLIPSNDLAFMSVLNDIYMAPPIYQELARHMEGQMLSIDNPILSILAGTQPGFLAEIFPEAAFGMGFMSRLIMVFSSTKAQVSLFDFSAEDRDLENPLINDLRQIGKLQGEFAFTPDARDAIDHWYLHEAAHDGPSHSRLMHYCSRRILHMLKLCMAFSVAERNDLIITLENFHDAHSTLLAVENKMPDIFHEMTARGHSTVMEEAVNFMIITGKGKPISEAKLTQFLASRLPATHIDHTLNAMIKAQMIKEIQIKNAVPGLFVERLFVPFSTIQ